MWIARCVHDALWGKHSSVEQWSLSTSFVAKSCYAKNGVFYIGQSMQTS